MKEKKVNMKSIRFTNTVKEIIENFSGNGFNEKFENLILHCMNELPEIETSINYYNKEIEKRKNDIKNFDSLLEKLHTIEKYTNYALNETKN